MENISSTTMGQHISQKKINFAENILQFQGNDWNSQLINVQKNSPEINKDVNFNETNNCLPIASSELMLEDKMEDTNVMKR